MSLEHVSGYALDVQGDPDEVREAVAFWREFQEGRLSRLVDKIDARLEADDVLLTLEEVASALRLSRRTVGSGMKDGRIPGFQVEGRWRCRRSSLRRWFDAQDV